MKLLKCEYCGFENHIDDEKTIFCPNCNKKIKKNFIDWKHQTYDPNLNKYLNELENVNTTSSYILTDNVSKNFISTKSIYLLSVMVLVVLLYFFYPEKKISEHINWKTKTIFDSINVELPFELESNETILPYYLMQYIKTVNSYRSEFKDKLFIDIEEVEFSDYISPTLNDLSKIYSKEMQNPYHNFKYNDSPIILFMNGYMSRMDIGEYQHEGVFYNFENFSFLNNKKAIKIIVNYEFNDTCAKGCNDKIINSILKNLKIK